MMYSIYVRVKCLLTWSSKLIAWIFKIQNNYDKHIISSSPISKFTNNHRLQYLIYLAVIFLVVKSFIHSLDTNSILSFPSRPVPFMYCNCNSLILLAVSVDANCLF